MATTDPEITPSDLKFRFQIGKQMPASIAIYNPSSDRLAFKVKTTTPKKYVVRPSSGIVEPKTTANVQVIMQAQKEHPADFANCKDKFLVQTVIVTANEEITADTFKKELRKTDVKETKLRVILEGPPAPPSPVPEANEADDDSTTREGDHVPKAKDDVTALNAELKALRAKLAEYEAQDLRKGKDKGAAGKVAVKGQASGGSTILFLIEIIIVAVLAAAAGKYYL